MSAVEILEKLGADSQFDVSQLSPTQLNELIKLSGDDDDFEPPLIHHKTPEDEEDGDDNKG